MTEGAFFSCSTGRVCEKREVSERHGQRGRRRGFVFFLCFTGQECDKGGENACDMGNKIEREIDEWRQFISCSTRRECEKSGDG